MIFNIISIVGLIVMVLLNWGLKKFKYGMVVVQILSIVLFVYKSVFYIWQNIQGHLNIPVEISSISYFLLPIILTFKIKKLYNVAAFFGIASGLGFFLFYCFAGFTVASNFTISHYLFNLFTHAYLLTTGLQVMFRHRFENKPHYIWIAMLSIICWAMAFYDFSKVGITFVYYIIKPNYLCLFSFNVLNFLLIVLFYSIVVTLFHFAVKLFYKVNSKVNANTEQRKVVNEGIIEIEEKFSN